MEDLSLDVDELKKEYALSCVENCILTLISQKCKDWEAVYSESFLSISKVIDGLNKGGYSYFKGVPRLHAVAMDYGMVKMRYLEDKSVFDPDNKNYYAFMVNEDYMKLKYNAHLWRADHFILAHNANSGEIEFLNDTPPDHGFLTTEECVKNYNNKAIVFEFDEYVSDKSRILENCKINAEKIEEDLEEVQHNQVEYDIEKIRDALCVEKVLVKRQGEFLRFLGEDFDNSDYYNYLNGLNAKVEYMRLRKQKTNAIEEMIQKLIEVDKKYYRNILSILRRIQK